MRAQNSILQSWRDVQKLALVKCQHSEDDFIGVFVSRLGDVSQPCKLENLVARAPCIPF